MRVAAFMSGSGTNVLKLLEYAEALRQKEGDSPYEVIFIFSDRSDGTCAGESIARQSGIPYFSFDIRTFHRRRDIQRTVRSAAGLAARKEYDAVARKLVQAFAIDVIALGGYMSYLTLKRCVNVHPADLSIRSADGRRRYVGDNAVYDAIKAGEQELRSSTLWTDAGIDTGPLMMVSEPLKVTLPEPFEMLIRDRERFQTVVDEHQEKLKKIGDWKIFPRTIELIARGHFALDQENLVHFDGQAVPDGYRE
jgi:folate-dependent phosphoribosylglycinamide formyltransferase PurN